MWANLYYGNRGLCNMLDHSKRKEEIKKEIIHSCGQENFNLPLAAMWPYYCHDCDQIQQPTPCPIEGQSPTNLEYLQSVHNSPVITEIVSDNYLPFFLNDNISRFILHRPIVMIADRLDESTTDLVDYLGVVFAIAHAAASTGRLAMGNQSCRSLEDSGAARTSTLQNGSGQRAKSHTFRRAVVDLRGFSCPPHFRRTCLSNSSRSWN